jgi:hypothetical protein
MTEAAPKPPVEEPPPFLGSWRRVYVAVIAWLAVLIILFHLFARAFS